MPRTRVNDIKVRKIPRADAQEEIVRVLDREKSVFADWIVDTPETLAEAADIDVKHWNIKDVCYDDSEYDAICELVHKYYSSIKHIHTHLISSKDFPVIKWPHFRDFCKDIEFIDEEECTMADIERFYFPQPENEGEGTAEEFVKDPEKSINRTQFIELVIRIAHQKFMQSGVVDTTTEAVEMMFQYYMKKRYTPDPWQDFRAEELWVDDVNDVFQLNAEALNKVYKELTTNKGKLGKIVLKKTIEMVT